MADLSSLILLRNDPEAAADLLAQAELGDVNAQYGMGLIYAEGRGVPQDEALAFLWLTLAGDQGDQDALSLRDVIGAGMSDADHTRALALYKARRPFGGSPALRRMKRRQILPDAH
jgi:TPR repeat protein